MAPLLVGLVANPITGAMATSGLIGAGGAVTAGGLLTATGVGLSAASLISQGQAAKAQGKSSQNIANYNAAVAEQEAEATRQKARFEQKRQAERGARTRSSQTVAIAKAGGLGSPVAADLAAEQASELELENLLIGYEGEVGAKRAKSQATLDRLQGRLSAKEGRNIKRASFVGAGGSLLTGFGSRLI